MAELPHLLQLQERYTNEIAAISWNLDHTSADSEPSASLQQKVLTKLRTLKLTCQNVVSSDPIDTVQNHYDVLSLPAVLVYDHQGKLARKFEGGDFSYENDVTPFVASLLDGA